MGKLYRQYNGAAVGGVGGVGGGGGGGGGGVVGGVGGGACVLSKVQCTYISGAGQLDSQIRSAYFHSALSARTVK